MKTIRRAQIFPVLVLATLGTSCVQESVLARRLGCRPPIGCQDSHNGADLARFEFDGDLGEVSGRFPLRVVGMIEYVESEDGCGTALEFGAESYLVLANDDAWELEGVEVSFRFRPTECGAGQLSFATGLVSRDADFQDEPGHLTIGWTSDCELWVRLQGASTSENTQLFAPAALDQWHSVTVFAGPPALEVFVDGELAAEQPTSLSIRGNSNPWVIGANSRQSRNGEAEPVLGYAEGIRIDHLVIRDLDECSTDETR